ncbi:hypothetical protein ACTA71_004692 [Dictyostelium dimigraforme]
MSRVKVLVDNQLDSELVTAGKRLVVVDFTATWCGPCKMISPYFEQLSSEYKDVIFLKVDVDQCKSTTQSQGVRAMPTFKFFIERKQVHEFSGADKNQLKSSIERLQPQLSFASQGNALGGGGGSSRQAYLDSLEKKQQEQQAQYQQQYGNTTTSPTVPTSITSSSTSTGTSSKSRPPARATQPDPIMMKDLIEMGFPENRARKALIIVNNSSSQSAMDWIFENMDSPTIDDPLEGDTGAPAKTTTSESTTTTTTTSSTTSSTTNNDNTSTTTTSSETTTEYPTTVHNALCDMCQNQIIGYRYKCKVCPNYDLCQQCKDTGKHNPEHEFVAHEKDIENYQMTPEEKAEQKRRLDARIQEIRVKKAEEEAKREIEREINRRQGGKSTQQALTKWQEDQLKREQEKDRKEKEADRIAKAKIKAKVEADRLERAAKKNATLNNNVVTETKPTPTPTPTPVYVPKQNYTESLIQIRLTDGSTIKGTFPLSTKLIDVHTFISNNTSQHGKFTLSSTYPRKIYSNDELKSISVEDAGLVPNGTLQVQKL